MQIAEKYRKQLEEYNEGSPNLPVHAQNGVKQEKDAAEQSVQVPHLPKTPKDEVEAVDEANTVNESEKGGESTSPRAEETSGK